MDTDTTHIIWILGLLLTIDTMIIVSFIFVGTKYIEIKMQNVHLRLNLVETKLNALIECYGVITKKIDNGYGENITEPKKDEKASKDKS